MTRDEIPEVTFMSRLSAQLRYVVAALLPLAVLAGCASAEKEQAAKAQLERARAAYQQAQANPNVQKYAAPQLSEAQRALQAAEQEKDLDDIQQLGYVAEKRAEIASLNGATSKAEQDVQQLSKDTAAIVAQKRERELKAARLEAETKSREADQARAAAEARAREAEAAVKAREAEQMRVAALSKELSDLKAKQTDRGVVLTVGDVLFATGKADIASGSQQNIDRLADFLKKYPNRNLLIEGYTDNTGSVDANVKLSQQRADAVRDLLVSRGIPPQRITTKGYGPKYPLVDNTSAAGRQQNRRVEIVVLNEGVSADNVGR
jgi:OOP family OmpA-OmpF porin